MIVCSIQKLKTSIVFLLWSQTKLSIVNGPSTLVEFIDCVGLVEVQAALVIPWGFFHVVLVGG